MYVLTILLYLFAYCVLKQNWHGNAPSPLHTCIIICDVSPFDLYILSGFANQLSCLVIFSLPFFGNHNLLFNRVNVLLTYTITGFKSAE